MSNLVEVYSSKVFDVCIKDIENKCHPMREVDYCPTAKYCYLVLYGEDPLHWGINFYQHPETTVLLDDKGWFQMWNEKEFSTFVKPLTLARKSEWFLVRLKISKVHLFFKDTIELEVDNFGPLLHIDTTEDIFSPAQGDWDSWGVRAWVV